MTPTGGFDLALQIADHALSGASSRMHAQGSLSHRSLRMSGGEFFDLIVGPPTVSATAQQPDGLARVVARTRVLERARPAADAVAVGRCAVADVSFRIRLDLTSAPGATISPDDLLQVDWTETSAADITFQRSDPGFENDARNAILEMTQEATGASVPLAALAQGGVNRVVPCTVPATGGGSSMTLALDLESGAGATTAIDGVLRYDWAIALSRDYVVGRLVNGLADRFGGAPPPPRGQAPLVFDERLVCLLNTPLGCLATATRRLLLTRLDLALAPGRMIVQGGLSQVTDGPLGTRIDADWSVDVTFQVDASGRIQAQVGSPTIQLPGLLGGFANFFSGGALERAIREGIVSALNSSLDSPEALSLIDGLVGRFGATAAGIDVRAVEIEVRPDGLVLHGIVDLPPRQQAPVASPAILAGIANPLRLVLMSGGSWAPGGDLSGIEWEPGGGAPIASQPSDCRQAIAHDYPAPGGYTVCLELTDAVGRVTRTCERVDVGTLRFRLVCPDAREDGASWRLCAAPGETVSVDVLVTGAGTPLEGVTVTLRGGNWTDVATTDGQGVARMSLDVDDVGNSPAAGGTGPRFNLGGFDTEVAAPGWVGVRQRVWLVDCAGAGALRLEALRARDRWLERLAGYAELNRIREQLGRTPSIPVTLGEGEGPVFDPPPFGLPREEVPSLDFPFQAEREPRFADVAGIGAAAAVLDQLTNLIAVAPNDRFSYDVLGISPDGGSKAVIKRLGTLWNQLDRASQEFEQTYGGGPEQDRPH